MQPTVHKHLTFRGNVLPPSSESNNQEDTFSKRSLLALLCCLRLGDWLAYLLS
jgi:hypothetical protein